MAVNSVGRTTIQGATTVGGFNPLTLFTSGEQGVWYDPSDLSTMYQDSAGTIPITALEQPVGRINDKSGRGNNATQATSGSRPVLSARVNLLTYTQDFRNTATAGSTRPWIWQSVTATYNSSTAPDGTLTANLVDDGTASAVWHELSSGPFVILSGVSYTVSAYVKDISRRYFNLSAYYASGGTTYAGAIFDLQTGTVTTGSSAWTLISTSMENVGNGWYRCSLTFSGTTNLSSTYFDFNPANSTTISSFGLCPTYTGSNKQLYIWGADLRATNQGVGLPPYQRVGAATYGTSTTAGNADYDANGFPYYLSFDGTSDSLATGSINFSSGDQVSAFAGVRKNRDTAISILTELSTDWFSNPGFALAAPNTVAANYGWNSNGTSPVIGTSTNSYSAPNTAVLAGTAEINPSSLVLRINGVQNFSVSTSQGTGNYGNNILYIGARGGSSLYFNGLLYGLIVRGASSTSNQITGAENWLNQRTRAY